MATAANLTYNTNGRAEDFHDLIYDISPTDTPFLTRAKRLKASQTLHQWQTDALDTASANAHIEGDDASFATAPSTTVLNNYTQISKKTLFISRTAETVRKYGRKSEVAKQLIKKGKELKRDIEYAAVRNQAATAGAAASARQSASFESWLGGNRVIPSTNTTGTSTPITGGTASSAPTDGTTGTFTEAHLQSALQLAWEDGGDPSLIMMSALNKRLFNAFSGVATKFNEVKGATQANIIGAADVYVSDFGNHMVVLNRYMRNAAVFCIDPEYIGIAWLDPIRKEELAKTGDGTKHQIVGEWTLVVQNPDAHAKIMGVGAA
jgi:hypothetical protein